jgi:hypothetical protein
MRLPTARYAVFFVLIFGGNAASAKRALIRRRWRNDGVRHKPDRLFDNDE